MECIYSVARRPRFLRFLAKGLKRRTMSFATAIICDKTKQKMCVLCCRLKPKSLVFPQLKEFVALKFEICRDCLVDRILIKAVHEEDWTWLNIMQYSKGGEVHSKCKRCRGVFIEGKVHAHYPFTISMLCEHCHMIECRDGDCEGWPKGYNEIHRQFFRRKARQKKEQRRAKAKNMSGSEYIINECECHWCELYAGKYPSCLSIQGTKLYSAGTQDTKPH